MTSNELMNQARCISCEIPPGMQVAVLIGLMDQLATAGGVIVAGGGMLGYADNYGGGVPTPVPGSGLAWAADTSNNRLWVWFSGVWHDSGINV